MDALREAIAYALQGDLSKAQEALIGIVHESPLEEGLFARALGLISLLEGDEKKASAHLARSVRLLEGVDVLEHALSERLYGLALIRALREVEGTFALERADATLDDLGIEDRPVLPD